MSEKTNKTKKTKVKNERNAMLFEGVPVQLRRAFKAQCILAGVTQKAAIIGFMECVASGFVEVDSVIMKVGR